VRDEQGVNHLEMEAWQVALRAVAKWIGEEPVENPTGAEVWPAPSTERAMAGTKVMVAIGRMMLGEGEDR